MKFLKYLFAVIGIVVITIAPYSLGSYYISKNIIISDWMSFYGGYFGAIIGLIGVIASIFYSSYQAKKDRLNTLDLAKEERRHSKMPFLILEDGSDVSIKKIENFPRLIVGKSSLMYFPTSFKQMSFKNIGTGPATDFILKFEKTIVQKDKVEIYDFEGAFKTSVLDQDKKFDFCIVINEDEDSLQKTFSTETPYAFEISLEYKDIFDNKYIQQFKFAYRLAINPIDGYRDYYKLVFLENYFNNGKPIFLN